MGRWYYWVSGSEGICPLDGSLDLPCCVYSYAIQKTAAEMISCLSIEQTSKILRNFYRYEIAPAVILDISRNISKEARKFRDLQPPPPVEKEKEILVVSVDGKGIPVKKGEIEKPNPRDGKEQKKQMARVGVIYTTNKFIKTPDKIIEGKAPYRLPEEAAPGGKKITASLTRRDEIWKNLRYDAKKRETSGVVSKVFISDGEAGIWLKKHLYFSDYVGILDIYHVIEKLWECACCFYPQGGQEAKDYVSSKLLKLLYGRFDFFIMELKQQALSKKLSEEDREVIRSVAAYCLNRREEMKYDEYLRKGYPIGSGNIESACKTLIHQRMECSGMRWSRKGAESILQLRSIYLNGDIDDFFDYYRKRERIRLYGGWICKRREKSQREKLEKAS